MKKVLLAVVLIIALASSFYFASFVMMKPAETETEQEQGFSLRLNPSRRYGGAICEKVEGGWLLSIGPWESWAENKGVIVFDEVLIGLLNCSGVKADAWFEFEGSRASYIPAEVKPGESFTLKVRVLEDDYCAGTMLWVEARSNSRLIGATIELI